MLNIEIIEKIENNQELKNLSIDGYTSPCPVTINENDNLTMAFSILEKEKFRHLPVVDNDGKLVGILSERDLHALQDFSSLKHPVVKDCMEEDVIAVQVGASLLETAFLLSDKKIGSVLVRDAQGKLEGIFTTTDALNALIEIIRGEVEFN
jgi:acetoin utilization protein AcuB